MKENPLLDCKPVAGAKVHGSHRARMEHLLKQYSERGLTLEYIAQPRIVGRSIRTLQAYCRKFSVSFSDYTPTAMLPPKVKKPKPVKTSKRYSKSRASTQTAENLQ